MQEEVLLNGPKAMKPSLIGKSDKFPSGKFVTNHFDKKQENTRYIQLSIMQHRNYIYIRILSSKLDFAFCKKIKCEGWTSLKHLIPCC
jgi:hypothetical protein